MKVGWERGEVTCSGGLCSLQEPAADMDRPGTPRQPCSVCLLLHDRTDLMFSDSTGICHSVPQDCP
jgi:hypothetical protein